MFDDLTGNQQVKTLLRRTLAAGRVPGAFLFSGEDGVGKKLFALELAKALNCRKPVETSADSIGAFEGCGKCPACERIAKFKAVIAGDRNSVRYLTALFRQFLAPRVEIVD